MVYLYLIQNKSGALYFGATTNLRRRIFDHNAGRSLATRGGEWQLVYYEAFRSEKDARDREHQIKFHGQAKRRLKQRLKNSLEQS